MKAVEIDVAIVAKPAHFFHFALYTPRIFSMPSFVVIPAEGTPTVLVQAIRGPKAKAEVPYGQILCYGSWSDNPSIAADPCEALRLITESYHPGNKTVGLELGFLSLNFYSRLTDALSATAIRDISGIITDARLRKDELALDRIRMAADLCTHGMTQQIRSLRDGSTERTACAFAMAAVMKLAEEKYPDMEMSGFGTDEESISYSFSFSCTSGIRSSFGSAQPLALIPKAGNFVLPCTTVRLGGYAAECERSLYVEALSPEHARIFQNVLEAREMVFERIRPGVTFSELYSTAKQVFVKNGMQAYLAGRIGHGIGLGNHEKPFVDAASDYPLQPGMVFTVEPSVMSSKFGGVRPSDTVIVTENGYELLTPAENGFLKIS